MKPETAKAIQAREARRDAARDNPALPQRRTRYTRLADLEVGDQIEFGQEVTVNAVRVAASQYGMRLGRFFTVTALEDGCVVTRTA